ncbi:hypothetical protein HK096_009344, partial [Nowakowskiella sp. JEL0078]
MGMIFIRLEKFERALEMFSNSLQLDSYFALAYFQRGYCFFMLDDFRNCYEDYSQALELLLDNDTIDYEKLGLKHKLYRCEVAFNRGVTLQQIRADPYEDFESARKNTRTPEQRSVIERATRGGDDDITLFTVPIDGLFQVREEKLKNIDKKNYMKEAKIVMSADNEDDFVGFSGAQILTGNGGTIMRNPSQNTFGRSASVNGRGKSPARGDSQRKNNDSRPLERSTINRSRSDSAPRLRMRSDEDAENSRKPFPDSNRTFSPEKSIPPKSIESRDRDFGNKTEYGNTIPRKNSKSRLDARTRQSSLANRGGPGALYSRAISPVGRANEQSEYRSEPQFETSTVRRDQVTSVKDK